MDRMPKIRTPQVIRMLQKTGLGKMIDAVTQPMEAFLRKAFRRNLSIVWVELTMVVVVGIL